MRAQKQQEHIWGSKEFIRRIEQAKAANTTPPSAFKSDVDVETLVREHIGKGFVKRAKGGSFSEYFSAGYEIGQAYLRGIQAYEPTLRVCVKYSKNGWHAFPVEEALS